MNPNILQVHEDQLMEKGHSVLFRKEAIQRLGYFQHPYLGQDTGHELGGVPIRVGDLIIVRWHGMIKGDYLAFVTGKGKKQRLRVRKWRGSRWKGWTNGAQTLYTKEFPLARPSDAYLMDAAQKWAFRDPREKGEEFNIKEAFGIFGDPLKPGEMSVFYGSPKSGKSSFTYNMYMRHDAPKPLVLCRSDMEAPHNPCPMCEYEHGTATHLLRLLRTHGLMRGFSVVAS